MRTLEQLCQSTVEERERLAAEKALTELRLSRATVLLESLKDEQVRWHTSLPLLLSLVCLAVVPLRHLIYSVALHVTNTCSVHRSAHSWWTCARCCFPLEVRWHAEGEAMEAVSSWLVSSTFLAATHVA